MGCSASNDHVDAVMNDDLLHWTVVATHAGVPPRDQFAVVAASRSDVDLMSAADDSPEPLSLNPLRGTGSCEHQDSTLDHFQQFGRHEESRSMSAYLNRSTLKAVTKQCRPSIEVSQRACSIEDWLASVSVIGETQEDVLRTRASKTLEDTDCPSFVQSPASGEE
jgi:hypothetical protein